MTNLASREENKIADGDVIIVLRNCVVYYHLRVVSGVSPATRILGYAIRYDRVSSYRSVRSTNAQELARENREQSFSKDARHSAFARESVHFCIKSAPISTRCVTINKLRAISLSLSLSFSLSLFLHPSIFRLFYFLQASSRAVADRFEICSDTDQSREVSCLSSQLTSSELTTRQVRLTCSRCPTRSIRDSRYAKPRGTIDEMHRAKIPS